MSRNFKSKKGSGDVWNPKIMPDGETKLEADDNDFIDGTYVEKKENVGEYKSTVYVLEKEETGDEVSVWGNAVLNDQFKNIPVGSFIRIKYLGGKLKKRVPVGEKFSEKKKNFYFDWEVFVDEDSKPAPAAAQPRNMAPALQPQNDAASFNNAEEDSLPF